jgi:arsenate reductase
MYLAILVVPNALYPMAAQTLSNLALKLESLQQETIPIYSIKYADTHPVIGFLKKDEFKESEFAAIMTCSQADGGCPFIAGAESVFQLHMKIESI